MEKIKQHRIQVFTGLGMLSLGIVLFLGFSFQQKILPSEMMKWVKEGEHGLHKSRTIDGVTLDVQYKPVQYLVSQDKRSNNFTYAEYNRRSEDFEGLQHYNLKIRYENQPGRDVTNAGVSTMTEQQERIYYLAYSMKEHIHLIEGNDTLNCALYHFERSYDIAPHRTFVLAFEQKPETKFNTKTLVVDIPFLKTGPVKFMIEGNALKRIPELKLN